MAVTYYSTKTTSTGGNVSMKLQGGYDTGTVSRTSGTAVSVTLGGAMGHTGSWTSNQMAMWFPGGGTKVTVKNSGSSSSGTYTQTRSVSLGTSATATSVATSVGFGWNAWTATQGNTCDFTVSFPAYTGSFNLNILLPDGSEPYSTGAAGTVEFSSNGGSSYSRIYNEPASSYTQGTSFVCRNFSPGAGLYLSGTSGFNSNGGSGPWYATQGSSTTLSFSTAWNTYYRDINAWKPGNSEQNGLIFDYYIYNRSGTLVNSYTNVTNEQSGTVTREYGYTGKINNIRTNVTGAHYTTNNVTGTGASEFTWTYNNGNAIELYSAWNTYTVVYNANGGAGSMSNTSATYNTAFNLRSNAFTRVGYSFAGWSTSSTATSATYSNGQSVNNLTSTNGGTVTLYAIWTANSLPSTSLTVNEILPTSVSLTPTANGKLYYVRNLPIYYSNMPIKVMSDGSVWARVYYHDSKGGTVLWSSASEAKNTQGTDKYSRLGELGNSVFKNSANKLELMLTYPTNSASGYNRWKQTSNPCDVFTNTGQGTFVPGYEAVHIDWSGSSWGGLERTNSDANAITHSYLDGSVGFSNWWFAVAPSEKYEGGFPGPGDIVYRQCEIWARIPSVSGQSVSVTANTKITLSGLLDESDWYFCSETTNSTGVAYSTTQKATTPVDQAKIRIHGADLPDKYRKVEYIQTDGAQLINLGKVGDTVTTYDIAFISDNHRQLMGYGGTGTEYWGATDSTKYESGGTQGETMDTTRRRDITWTYSYKDGISKVESGSVSIVNPHGASKNVDGEDYKLFNIYSSGDLAQYGVACKLYGLQMWHYGNLIRNLIPCYRKSDNVIGLFDTVGMTFYTNIGTGSFSKGPNREIGTGWLKGKTYYKKDGAWVKAKKIYIKVNGQWKVGSNYD